MSTNKVTNVSDLRLMFHRNQGPIYFVSATNFNLLGIDEWVGGFRYINYIDCFDGHHPNVIVPPRSRRRVQAHRGHQQLPPAAQGGGRPIERRGGRRPRRVPDVRRGDRGDLPRSSASRSASRRPAAQRCDDKMETCASATGRRRSGAQRARQGRRLRRLADRARAKLGATWWCRSAFGDSGHTTFFISSEADYPKHAEEIEPEPEVKVMKRIRCRGAALEACVTGRHARRAADDRDRRASRS